MKNQYKIFKQLYYNNDGKENLQYYFIKQRKEFLGLEYWKAVKHKESGYCDSYMTVTRFSTMGEAEAFIRDVLCPGRPRNKWVDTEVKSMECQS
jgi:hypothetical protein